MGSDPVYLQLRLGNPLRGAVPDGGRKRIKRNERRAIIEIWLFFFCVQTAKKEKTDRNVMDLVGNTRKILENNEKSNCMK